MRALTAFSFYATKNLTTAEGGMLTGAPELIDRAPIWSLHDMSRDNLNPTGKPSPKTQELPPTVTHPVAQLGRERVAHFSRDLTPRIRGTTPEIEAAARRLRQNMTPAELKLWDALKNRQLDGLKFRREHPVGPFILDFWCPARKLVIELDGEVHEKQKDYDEARTRQLEDYGYRVMRFRNEEVLTDLPAVLDRIREVVRSAP